MVMDGNNRSHRAPVLPQGAPGAYRPSGDLGVLSGRYADDAKPRAAAIAVIAGEAHCVDMSLALVRYDEIERTPEGGRNWRRARFRTSAGRRARRRIGDAYGWT